MALVTAARYPTDFGCEDRGCLVLHRHWRGDGRMVGLGDLREDAAVRGFIRTHPFVAFCPATTSPA